VANPTATRSAQTTAGRADASLGAGSLSRTEWLLVTGLTAASAVVNLADLASRSLWNDELHSALIAVHHGISLWSAHHRRRRQHDVVLPAAPLFRGAFRRRTASLCEFRLRWRAWGLHRSSSSLPPDVRVATAAIATAIVAVSPALVLWNQQARGYALGTLLIALSLLALLRAFEFPRRRRWCLYGVLLVLSIYTLAYVALFVVAQWLALAFWPRARIRRNRC